jgi:DNA adenine methylase
MTPMAAETSKPVDPLPGAAPWVGGKRQLASRIIARIGAIPHTCYAEPFLGMGGVFFRRPRRPPAEAINDLNREVSNLFRVLQRHPDALFAELRWKVNALAEFDRLRAENPDLLTDVERAARFAFIQYATFGGKVRTTSFGRSTTGRARFEAGRVRRLFEAMHERLGGVHIDGLPYAEFIERWDRPGTLFYVDPPYHGHEGDYGRGMYGPDDFARLAGLLARIKGRFLLSLNDVPEVRDIFSGFDMEEVALTYTVGGGGKAKAARELLISGGGGS